VASQSVTHDAKGNMMLISAVLRPTNSGLPPTASRLTWDFENKLIAADTDNDSTDDIFYKFDALGRRVGRDDGTANVVYFQDGQQTIADYPSGTAAGSPTYTYIYASYIDEPVMRGGSGGLRYYHHNQQYSITAVSDGDGSVVERYAYSPYGQVTIADASGTEISDSAIANRYTYTGREWDDGLSLYHYRARMYDAVGGRFVSRDPMGHIDGYLLYRLSRSNPSRFVDPLGSYCGEPWEHLGVGSLIDEDDLAGMRWYSADLSQFNAYGLTYLTVSAECNCVECCGEWFIESVSFNVDIKILIDDRAINSQGAPWGYSGHDTLSVEGVYGHEQLHVRHIMEQARNLFSGVKSRINSEGRRRSFGTGQLGRLGCNTECLQIRSLASTWRTVLFTESGHTMNPTPEQDREYPPFGTMPRHPSNSR
jgi:RHS repeat-associated protein